MKCIKCGKDIVEGAAFCLYCGEKVAAAPGAEAPLYQAEISGMLRSGKLIVYRDRAEFVTSKIQKTIFDYSDLIAVKKGLDRIYFLTDDGKSESCAVNRKDIHEAFLYVDQATRPYIAKKKELLLAEGIKFSIPCGSLGMNSGLLNILDDRIEFRAKSGNGETVSYRDVKSAQISAMGMLELSLHDGKTKSYAVEKESRDEVLSFVTAALAPYLAERKETLLADGIHYSFLSSSGFGSGTLNILDDRAEYMNKSGQSESIHYANVRAVRLAMGKLEFALTDGKTRSFTIEKDIRDQVLFFLESAIEPYVAERTVGFNLVFGIDERIEINEARGVLHIIRQNGNEITCEYPLSSVVKCENTETKSLTNALNGITSGNIAGKIGALTGSGAKTEPTAAPSEKLSRISVLLTMETDQGLKVESIHFGSFPLGMSKENKKYEAYATEILKFNAYMETNYPECELIVPVPEPAEIPETTAAEIPAEEATATVSDAAEKDHLGILKYIDGVSKYLSACATPMTIAIQGDWGAEKNSIMKMIHDELKEKYKGNLIWLNTWQFSQYDAKEQYPMLLADKLVQLLGGTKGVETKDRAINIAKGLISITSGFISQGGSDGQKLTEALFKDNSVNPLEKLTDTFSNLVSAKTKDGIDKVIIFVDDLDSLAPAKAVELLEVIKKFFVREQCAFVFAIDYNAVLRGVREKYGQSFDDRQAKNFYDSIVQISFRVPASGFDMQNYVKDTLKAIGIHTDDETEINYYVELIKRSVGCEPESMKRLFNSFLLLKNMADEEIYGNKDKRLMLFALLCMQRRFKDIYDYIVRVKDKVTSDFLSSLCREDSEALKNTDLTEDDNADFCEFAKVFCAVIDTGRTNEISESECETFRTVLNFSSITSK